MALSKAGRKRIAVRSSGHPVLVIEVALLHEDAEPITWASDIVQSLHMPDGGQFVTSSKLEIRQPRVIDILKGVNDYDF